MESRRETRDDLFLSEPQLRSETITAAAAGTWPKGTLLARNSSTLKLEAYADAGANDLDNPRSVLPHELVFAAAGDLATQVAIGGKVNENRLSKLGDATAIGKDVIDKLIANSNIVPQTVRNTSVFDD